MKSIDVFALALLSLSTFAKPTAAQESVGAADPAGALGVSPDEVFAAWDARAAEVHTLEAVWDQQEMIRRGSLHSTTLTKDGEPSLAPEQDTSISSVCEVRLGGDRVYTGRTGSSWESELNAFVDRVQEALLERDQFTMLSQVGQQRVEPRATIMPVERYGDPRSVPYMPMFLAVRARDKSLAPVSHEGGWSVAPVTAVVDGKTCIVLERTVATYSPELVEGELRETYWIDPASEFCIRRFERTQGGRVELQIDLDYTDSTHAWLPTAWKSVIYSGTDALAVRRYDARLRTFVVNSPASNERLQLEFPVGTAVNDVVSGELWIALANGGRRTVTAGELARGASYAQLLASEPGQAGLPPWRPWRVLASMAALVLAAGVVISRWRVRRSVGEPALAATAGRPSSGWLAMLALGASLALAAFAARESAAAPVLCAGRCHGGVWSAYRHGFSYRLDFLTFCRYRAWSTDINMPYASSNGCSAGLVPVNYFLVFSTKWHACTQYAATGDLMHTWDSGGTQDQVGTFQCCNPAGTCYGSN